ncbi:MAG: hypothetical protein KA781_10100 [Aquabacterium sp.]|nr:hypothetical protein [Aquabacterium sp.]
MDEKTKSDVQTCIEAAGAGLWGLVVKALLEEGKTGALAAMDKVLDGRAFVQIEVLFTKRGMSAVGSFCSHGERSNLFSVTLNQPAPDVPPAPAALH